jgi:hypothetical protein
MKVKYTEGLNGTSFKSLYKANRQGKPAPTLHVNDNYRFVVWLSTPTIRPRENAAEAYIRSSTAQNDKLLAAFQVSSFLWLFWLALFSTVVAVASLSVAVVALAGD